MKSPSTISSKGSSTAANLVWLVHGNEKEADAREGHLVKSGFRVVRGPWNSPEIGRKKANPPAAVIVDLSRVPSAGRDTAVAMRSHRALVPVPFLLIGGNEEALAKIKTLLPDAVSATWDGIQKALLKAIKSPPSGGRQLSVFDAYAGTPLWKKLGIRPGVQVAVVSAPDGVAEILGELPDGVSISSQGGAARDLTLWFVKSRTELSRKIIPMGRFAESGRLWIMWPKNGAAPEVNQLAVRKAGLDSGLVDFKIVRVNETWSGLCFTQRKFRAPA